MLANMTTDEIMHWLGELTSELARRADQPAQPAAPSPPWAAQPDVRAGAATPPRWRAPVVEPKARPFTQTTRQMVNMPAMPEGGLPPGTPLTRASVDVSPNVDPMVAAVIAQLQAQSATPTPRAPRAPGVVTTTPKTDPEAARVFLGVPPRPDGAPPINGAGIAAGGAIVEPA